MDSLCLLIPTRDFYMQQFNSSKIPYFSQKDTVVKVHLKVKEFISAVAFYNLKNNAKQEEETQIKNYFGSELAYTMARDSAGFYWVEKPKGYHSQNLAYSDELIITYEGYFLNGRFLEKSPERFEYTSGVPDQILKGLNYVIQKLKKGENAKIILPSALAFGENGSSNGTVPPFTPLLYNIKLIDVKTNEKN
jgi:FKBP-type peptidyl-prolyl cis-trans isomerase